MDYSQETADIIEIMCINVERLDFTLDKKNCEETILKTYDLFGLDRPKKIQWHKDIFTKKYQDCAGSAVSAGSGRSSRSAVSAWSAWSAGSAVSAWIVGSGRSSRSAVSAWSAWSAVSAWSARSAGSARIARSAVSAMSARSAVSAMSAMSAVDYDFDWFVMEHEYCKNRGENPGEEPNDNDRIYLDYCELLLQAKEYGLGYIIEYEGTLHLVQTPLVRINSLNVFHSDEVPAIRWKGGEEFYYLNGVSFEKKLWTKIVSRKMSLKDVMKIEDIDQRTQAMNYIPVQEFLEHVGGVVTDTFKKGNIEYKLYEIPEGLFTEIAYFATYTCPSTGKLYMSGISPDIGKEKNIVKAMAWKANTTEKDWKSMQLLTHES